MKDKSITNSMEGEDNHPPTTCASPGSLEAAHGSRRRHKQRQILVELLSELDSLIDDDDDDDDESKPDVMKVEKPSSSETEEKTKGTIEEEIMKEVKIIRRQNTITHYLLTASILLTLAWQLSELSLIFKIRQGLNNPLKSIGGAIKGLFTSSSSQESNDDQDASHTQMIPPTYLPGLKIPDLSHLDLPGFDTSNDDDDD